MTTLFYCSNDYMRILVVKIKFHFVTALQYSVILLTWLQQATKSSHIKVHLTPKSFFSLKINKSLHLFDRQCAFLPLCNPNLDLLQAVKVTKSGHHLLHDRASKGYGSIPGLTSQTSLHACLQRLNTTQISL